MTQVDVRPPGVDLQFRAGTTVTITLEWPAGSLTGRTFTSTLGGTALAVSVVGDTMTVEATDTQTADLTDTTEWLLLEDIGGTPEPIIIGTWTPSNEAQAVTSQTVQVTQGAATVNLTVTSASASVVAHEAEDLAHGPLEVDFVDGGVTFGPVTATSSGLHATRVTGAEVTIPDSPRPFYVDAQGVVRIQTSDGPGFVFPGLANAGAGEVLITEMLTFAPQYMPADIGNAAIIEAYFQLRARIPPNTPGDVQLCIGAHDNTTPPPLFTPIPVQLIVAGDHGHYKISATAA